MVSVDEARATPYQSPAYRPEIDGLRAVAVIAVLVNHIYHHWLPGGFLGVDLFFVISGYVVTASLARRKEANWREMLVGFYTRRFRRLLPALLMMVALTSLSFGLFVSASDDQFSISQRTGLASLFGVSNLFLVAQGHNYFEFTTQFNPFLHTWSLGVEEQFYLIWPLVVMLCGVGFIGATRRSLLLLLALLAALSVASFALYLQLHGGVGDAAAFYLMPARFWELAAGAIVLLLQLLRPADRKNIANLPLFEIGNCLLFVALLIGFVLTTDQASQFKPLFALIAAVLLFSLNQQSFLTKLLCHPVMLAIGVASYSLYLWHWPLIVLLRWTFGINALTLPPLLIVIAVMTLLSYRLETRFRFGTFSGNWRKQPLLLYPLATLCTAGFVGAVYRFLGANIFLGDSSSNTQNFSVGRSIPNSSITTYSCFLDPDAPPFARSGKNPCRAGSNPKLPTLFFEGDSVAHSLIPMLALLYESGRYNISFVGRGGCVFPYVEPWPGNRHLLPRYRGCRAHAKLREEAVLAQIKPGDQLVLATDNAYVQNLESQASYLHSVSRLATKLERHRAGLILFSPMPSFADRAPIKTPLSLCFEEWYRPRWTLPRDCKPKKVDRQSLLSYDITMKDLQEQLKVQHKNINIFDPFPFLCPSSQRQCSTHAGGTMMFYDAIHLTAAGGRQLYPAFQSFLQAIQASPARPHLSDQSVNAGDAAGLGPLP